MSISKTNILNGLLFTLDLIISSICYVICSLFIVTCGIGSCALFYSVNYNAKGDRKNIFVLFAKAIKKYWKKAIILTIFTLIGFVLITLSMWVSYQMMILKDVFATTLFFFGLIVTVFYIGFVSYLYPTLVYCDTNLKETIRISFRISIIHMPITALMAFVLIGTIIGTYYVWLSLFITPGLIAYVQGKVLKKIYEKYQNKIVNC